MTYEKSAPYYDAIYTQMKDYRAEAERVAGLIEANTLREGRRLLDMAGGTGLHAQYLRHHYDVTLIDLSSAQLAVARERLPELEIIEADMRSFGFGQTSSDQPHPPAIRRFDAITCLFSAIGHLPTVDDLRLVIRNFAAHLEPGGVLLIEPWLSPGMWRPGFVGMDAVDLPDVKICRMAHSTCDGNVITLKFYFTIANADGVETFTEEHEVTMFSAEEFHAAFAEAGLVSTFDPAGINGNGRGIYIAVRSLPSAT